MRGPDLPWPPYPTPKLVSRRVRRNRFLYSLALLVIFTLLGIYLASGSSGKGHKGGPPPTPPPRNAKGTGPVPKGSPLDSNWKGDGQSVTLAFAGDVDFPTDTTLGDRLAANPATALGPTVPALLSGADLSMVNFESALTNGTCPDKQSKEYVFYAPQTAVTAMQHAGITVATEANNHGMDCGAAGLQMSLAERAATKFPIVGIGQNAAAAFTPYQTTLKGQRIAIIGATQVIDSDLQTAWTATATQAGLASAYEVNELVSAVQAARKVADTVVVYLHWGTQTQSCPNSLQEPLANLLVKAGADIVVGTHAHVLLGAGYLGSAFVDYGLGNFAFYNNTPPENASGSLLVTVTGRQINRTTWRPAAISNDLPHPLSGSAANTAMASWQQARNCTDAAATPSASLSTRATETSPAPAATVNQLSHGSG